MKEKKGKKTKRPKKKRIWGTWEKGIEKKKKKAIKNRATES